MEKKSFKGISGGDPSRRPAPRIIQIPCHFCKKDVPFSTSSKSRPTLYCDETCRSNKRREETFASLKKHGINLSVSPNRSITSMTSLLKVCDLISKLSKGKKIYKSRTYACGTCKQDFSYFSLEPIRERRNYCSTVCTKNKKLSNVPASKAELCPRPEKLKFDSKEASQAQMATMKSEDLPRNEDLESYLCVCGSWHFGSLEKAQFGEEEKALLSDKRDILDRLIAQKPYLVVIAKS